jgi:hypothetical protein
VRVHEATVAALKDLGVNVMRGGSGDDAAGMQIAVAKAEGVRVLDLIPQIHPGRMVQAISRTLPERGAVIVDAGAHIDGAAYYLLSRAQGRPELPQAGGLSDAHLSARQHARDPYEKWMPSIGTPELQFAPHEKWMSSIRKFAPHEKWMSSIRTRYGRGLLAGIQTNSFGDDS